LNGSIAKGALVAVAPSYRVPGSAIGSLDVRNWMFEKGEPTVI
jgi:hypothetical protein